MPHEALLDLILDKSRVDEPYVDDGAFSFFPAMHEVAGEEGAGPSQAGAAMHERFLFAFNVLKHPVAEILHGSGCRHAHVGNREVLDLKTGFCQCRIRSDLG